MTTYGATSDDKVVFNISNVSQCCFTTTYLLFSADPVPKLVMIFSQSHGTERISVNIESKLEQFISRCIWNGLPRTATFLLVEICSNKKV